MFYRRKPTNKNPVSTVVKHERGGKEMVIRVIITAMWAGDMGEGRDAHWILNT